MSKDILHTITFFIVSIAIMLPMAFLRDEKFSISQAVIPTVVFYLLNSMRKK